MCLFWIYHSLMNSVFNMFLALFHSKCCSSSFSLKNPLHSSWAISIIHRHFNIKIIFLYCIIPAVNMASIFLHQTCTGKMSGIQNSCKAFIYPSFIKLNIYLIFLVIVTYKYKKLLLGPVCCSLTQFTRAWIKIMFELNYFMLVPFFCLVLVLEY